MRLPRRLHDLGQHAAHIPGMEEEDRRAVGADPGGAENTDAFAFEPGPRRRDVRYLEADMVLPARRILLEEIDDRGVRPERFDQLDLAVRRVDEADPDALRG